MLWGRRAWQRAHTCTPRTGGAALSPAGVLPVTVHGLWPAGGQPSTAGMLPPSDSEDEDSESSGGEEEKPKVAMVQVSEESRRRAERELRLCSSLPSIHLHQLLLKRLPHSPPAAPSSSIWPTRRTPRPGRCQQTLRVRLAALAAQQALGCVCALLAAPLACSCHACWTAILAAQPVGWTLPHLAASPPQRIARRRAAARRRRFRSGPRPRRCRGARRARRSWIQSRCAWTWSGWR